MITRHVCWDMDLVRRYFTTEASVISDRETFMALHLPINKLEVVDTKPMEGIAPEDIVEEGETRFTSEEGLLRAIQNSRPDAPNRIFVITGEPGSGKSHLARWVEFSLHEHPTHRPIHIPRYIDTLGSVVRRLLEQGEVDLGQDTFEQDWFKAAENLLADYVLANFRLRFAPGTQLGDAWPELAALVASPTFRQDVERQIARYKLSRQEASVGYKDREILALSADDFQRLAQASDVSLSGLRGVEAYDTLRYALKGIVRQLAGIGDFDLKAAMRQISERFCARGQRAVLILEDVTSFELLHEDLLTFLLDSSAGYFDAVIGWTIGFEREYMRTYQEQRYAARLSLTDNEQHETYCLMNGRYVELVRRYMALVRRDCADCAAPRAAAAFGPGLYPFNEAFLHRVYENLIADDRQRRRTPRHLLDRALKRYLEIAATDGTYPPLKQPVNVREILYDNAVDAYREDYPIFAALVAWYGVERDGTLCLSEAVPRCLGVRTPPEFEGQDEICLGLGQSTPIAVDVDEGERLARENQLKELYLELQEWFAGADPLEHVEVFRRGAYKVLTALKYDLPLRLENRAGSGFGYGMPLVYGRDRPETNIYVEGTRLQQPPMETVVLSRDSERWSEGQLKRLMQTMAYVELLDEYPEDADWALLGDWAATAYADYSRRVERLLVQDDRLKMSLEQFVLTCKFLLLNHDRGVAEPAYAAMAAPLDEATPIAQELLPQGVEYADTLSLRAIIDGLFQSLFYLSRDQVDYARLSGALADFYPDVTMGQLRRVSAYRVDPGSNFRIDGHGLEEVALALKKLSYALDVADFRLTFRQVRAELQVIAEACEEPLRQVVQRIGRIRNQLNQYDLYETLYSQRHWSAWDGGARSAGNGAEAELDTLKGALQELLASPAPQNVFQYIAYARRADAVLQDRRYQLLLAARRLLGDLHERLARQRITLPPLKGPDEVIALAARLVARLEGSR
jgi:hypothetical protein